MNKDFLVSALQSMENAKRENRDKVANIVYNNKELFKHLVSLTFEVDDKISIKAAWILEWICTHGDLRWMIPHLEEFTQNISRLRFDSAIRPCAKICEHLATAYSSKNENEFKTTLTIAQIDSIVETGFDWLITPQKIAVRAYTMTTLYLFGLQKDWIHPELEHLISTKIIKESKGCKARGTYILSLIKKRQKI
ncbi:adenylosuccinate lyase [Polaribacter gochangensis]|uniref:adenylosuccinate lyase n=1 Tax=Polaribacter gochangensis TaxID=3252903 RepID=UPI0039049E92